MSGEGIPVTAEEEEYFQELELTQAAKTKVPRKNSGDPLAS